MTELNKIILDLINKDLSINEISEITKLSNKQLYYRLSLLQFKGFEFKKRYHDNGDIKLYLNKDLNSNNGILIKTQKKSDEFAAVFISDLHFCNKKDRVDLINEIYKFCNSRNIHIIFNAGDLLDGMIWRNKNIFKEKTYESQIDYLLKNYPFDKNILNFICFGNHDIDFLYKDGQNISKVLENKRYDLIPIGYGLGKINIKDDHFYLAHPKTCSINIPNNDIVFHGHHHKIKTSTDGRSLITYLPTLSDIAMEAPGTYPGFILATFDFKDGIISKVYLQNFNFIKKRIKLTSENEFYLKDRYLYIENENKSLKLTNN